MAKVPEPGRCKTRLIPLLGEEAAARLALAMAQDVLGRFSDATVWVAGDVQHPWVGGLRRWQAQPEGDLGSRLGAALRAGGVAIGTDCPLLPASTIAWARENPVDLRLGVAEDGGYTWVQVSARAVAAGVFEGIPWSASETAKVQLERARELGMTVDAESGGWDVDEPHDLLRLRAVLSGFPALAPRTALCLASMRF